MQQSLARTRATCLARSPVSMSAVRPVLRVQKRSRCQMVPLAMMDPGPDGDKKLPLSRESEPDEYWSSASERKGANPFKDPVAIIGIVAILFPFIFVLIAIGTGAIDTSVYR